ncbi:MAG: hypothetical protein E6K79_01410 [Candidatus Eisenbacteria bacterium]|jgi:hypothetical protein|uniref:PH domain-containing protein n=1 Tax=Eiseniibacteriota bacterium TaxID=2212470 RepID=A0A538TSL2_UNCEI|nr:MAG: hypothetical protein E6K79_01410 [Candidatus Eisenbacteria bacterium]
MAEPHEERPRKAGELSWTAWPARERPLAAAVLIVAAVVLGMLVKKGTDDSFLGVAAPGFVLASLSSFLLPTSYRLTKESLEVRSLGVSRVRPWTEMRRMTVDRTGVFLSPFDRRNWLEAYRGVRLLFGGNRDQVVAFVEARIGRGAAEA